MKPLEERGPFRGYHGGESMPLGGYAVLVSSYLGLLGAAIATAGRERVFRLPVRSGDLLLLGGATFHLSRLVTRDWVTAPLRAPFVRFESTESAGEVREKSRGKGLYRAVGDLLTCNYCSGPWIALGLVSSWARWPGPTRFFASIFAISGLSTLLNRTFSLLGTVGKPARKRTPPVGLESEGQQERFLHS